MTDAQRKRERAATKASTKGLLICLAVLSVAGAGAWFALTTGLERLPSKVCEGSVDRDVVIRALPRTRTAEEGSSRSHEGKNLMFSCHIYTSADSILSGMTRVDDASMQQWLDHYGGTTSKESIRVSADGIEALAGLNTDSGRSSVYVPCVPRGVPAGSANESYAIITEASVVGAGRVSGAALRQAVSDFAYQLTKHVYEEAGCKDRRTFPEELPRYEDDR
ncbi:hypothetical protein [Streptomyces hilarionis]|uniref:hypothetical protein n=1 Tax=Streptomyces hilarionis TaxID=2839954 RepID=UPI002119BD2A|nr:hypothetical protein [Streptomyces hilarionis]MCQ9135059.1 hypothetical protein [Streptomyces hilarionis]